MDVLLIGAENPVGVALQQAVAHWGRHRLQCLTAAAAGRWTRERHAKKAARRGQPDAIVDLRFAWQVASKEEPVDLDVERCHWLAKACAHSGMRYLLVSSDQVFGGQGGRNLREDDPTDAYSVTGIQMVEAENRVLQAAPESVVVRSGPLFASYDNNMLTRMLGTMLGEGNAVFDHNSRFCPVASADLARVIAAMLDQLSVGAPASGVYHYCSTDRTTEYEFAEVLLAAAGQYLDCGDIVIESAQGAQPPELRSLDCSRLRDSFAIKQLPWRASITGAVREYVELRQKEPTA